MNSLQRIDSTSPFLENSLETLDQLETDAIVLGLNVELKPPRGLMSCLDWRLCGAVSNFIHEDFISGQNEKQILLPTGNRIKSPMVFLFGWGIRTDVENNFKRNFENMMNVLQKAGVKNFALGFPPDFPNARDIALLLLQENLPLKITGIFDPHTN